ncbi:MAG: protein O-mannosyl-transferase family [Thermomicrobiales bacterium]
MRLIAERPATVAAGNVGVQRDAIIAGALAALTVITRFPFRSHRAFNWDAVNFVLALHDYDVRLHHPQPPGYPVFAAMGRVVQLVIPNPNTALVIVAMLLSAGAVAALYLLGRTVFGQMAGIIAALYLLCSVTFWTNGAVALAYPSLALFTTLMALLAWRCHQRGRNVSVWLPLALSVAYAVGGGFRPDLLLFLLPLWIFGHWQLPFRTMLLSGICVIAIVLAWFVPTIALSGGWSGYWAVFRAYTSDDVLKRYSVAENGPRALLVNLRDTVKYTGYALYALAVPVAGAAVWLLTQWQRLKKGGPTAVHPYISLFLLWMMPVLLFYTWVHIGDPGYVFTFVPALLLIAARFTVELPRIVKRLHLDWLRRFIVPALTIVVIAANAGIFLFRPLTLTAHGIRQQDRTIDGKIAYVRAHGAPATTLLIAYESYRHWLLYLPEYHVRFVDLTYGTAANRTVDIPPGVTDIILMDATLLRAIGNTPLADTTAIENDRVAVVRTQGGSRIQFGTIASPLAEEPHPRPLSFAVRQRRGVTRS